MGVGVFMDLGAQYITIVTFNFACFPILKNLYYEGKYTENNDNI